MGNEWHLVSEVLPTKNGQYPVTIDRLMWHTMEAYKQHDLKKATRYHERVDRFDVERNEFFVHRDIIAWREQAPYIPSIGGK